ncbi:hypothetical protein [Parabacteroides pacaensis]|uniref:hypothetical protein n=1 Tax=Parabacteroides pacaensis TaxID=2086575 RepID=UPI00131D6C38|nr:hypothetical protein [Parabacteroides pacaensis]
MNKILHIIGLFCLIFLMSPENGFSQMAPASLPTEQGEVIPNDPAEQQREMQFVLSNDFKSCTCLTPRIIQLNCNTCFQRFSKNLFKQLNLFRVKEYNSQHKIWEFVSSLQNINYSSLLTRVGYHVYALRKIII